MQQPSVGENPTNSKAPLDRCLGLLHKPLVIKNFRNRALSAFWKSQDAPKFHPDLIDRLNRRLDALDQATRPDDMKIPGFYLRSLVGPSVRYSVYIDNIWHLTFEWKDNDAVQVALEACS
jgi:proteic killer suppression protein